MQVYAGRDALTGRKLWISRQVPGQTRESWKQAKQLEGQLLAEVAAGKHRGSRSTTVAEMVTEWLKWRDTTWNRNRAAVASFIAGCAKSRYAAPMLPAPPNATPSTPTRPRR